MITITLILFSLFSIFEGARDAQYFHYRWKQPFKFIHHEYLPFILLRSIVVIYATVIPMLMAKWYAIFTAVCLGAVFPFFHDGAFQYMRNHLEHDASKICVYPIKPWIRSVLLLFGYVLAIGLDIVFTWAGIWCFQS